MNEPILMVHPYRVHTDSIVTIIPKEIVRRLGIKPGCKLLVSIDDSGNILYSPIKGLIPETAKLEIRGR